MSTDRIRVVTGYDKALVEELVELQKKALPTYMQFDQPYQYYTEGLGDPIQYQHCHDHTEWKG